MLEASVIALSGASRNVEVMSQLPYILHMISFYYIVVLDYALGFVDSLSVDKLRHVMAVSPQYLSCENLPNVYITTSCPHNDT